MVNGAVPVLENLKNGNFLTFVILGYVDHCGSFFLRNYLTMIDDSIIVWLGLETSSPSK